MNINALAVVGAFEIRPTPITDNRGSFSRLYCKRELGETGMARDWVQANVSISREPRTLRGIHLQVRDGAEAKLVSCTSGKVWDLVVDLRPGSPTFLQWSAVILDAAHQNGFLSPRDAAMPS